MPRSSSSRARQHTRLPRTQHRCRPLESSGVDGRDSVPILKRWSEEQGPAGRSLGGLGSHIPALPLRHPTAPMSQGLLCALATWDSQLSAGGTPLLPGPEGRGLRSWVPQTVTLEIQSLADHHPRALPRWQAGTHPKASCGRGLLIVQRAGFWSGACRGPSGAAPREWRPVGTTLASSSSSSLPRPGGERCAGSTGPLPGAAASGPDSGGTHRTEGSGNMA